MGVCAHANPGTALRFNGTNSFVSIPHNSTLNAFPLTLTAWVRTLRTSAQVDGIVGKYFDGSGNGYSINLRNGRMYAWYLRNGGASGVVVNPFGLDGGVIADGQWHHIAFVVGTATGYLYVDGSLRNSVAWTGTPGPPNGTEPLQIGRYFNYGNAFQGDIDEVALWNRGLSASELNYLKHRRLGGTEDGLLGYWRFDEGSGTAANNSATNAFHGSLSNSPAWLTSHAPIELEPVAGSGLKLDGVNGFVTVSHNADLNAYPFTVSTWFRTTNGANVVQGLVTKSVDTGNAWSLIVQSGRLRGFYYRSFSNYAIDSQPAASVADGAWHHAALTVDASGGKLYLDGVLAGSSAWVGAAGPMTLTDPLQIGRYYNYSTPLAGAIDEVTVWNRALTAGEIGSMKNLPLAGNEIGLVAYWRFDEAAGTTASDATGLGHTGTLTNGAAWAGSTAYLGDRSVHLVASPDVPFNQILFALNGGYLVSSFGLKANATLWRFYDFGNIPSNSAVAFKFDAGLRVASSGPALAVTGNTYSNSYNFGAYNASTAIPSGAAAGVATINQSMNVAPAPGVQLDSVNNLHQMTAALSHNENGAAFSADGTEATDPVRLLHFNGHVLFGNVDIVVSNLVNTPVPGAVVGSSYIQSQLQIGANGAYFAAAPGVRFGGGAAFTVNLGVDGTATNVNGSFSFAGVSQFFETAGIRYRMPGLSLNSAGLVATNFEAWFPTGFGMTPTTNSRTMLPYVTMTNVVIGPNLLPIVSNMTFTAAAYKTNRLYFAEESKPLLFGAPQIEWHIAQGEFLITSAQTLEFVRQSEDADLSALRGSLVNPLAGDRVSNDGYYRNVIATNGVPIYVRPDTNGASLLTMQAILQEEEYRPHFPYMRRDVGGHIPVVGGTLIISNDLIHAASHLLLAGPVPVPYARDCSAEAGCTTFATTGPQVLSFTAPPGELGLGQLDFTEDGGLLAYGTIPAANLTWGFIGGSDYAQRTSDVSGGAYQVSGNFFSGKFLTAADLSGDQSYQLPARLVLTGHGSSNDVAYVERPDQANYNDGFANYAGLNFRSPVQGRSMIAGTSTGFYPLTTRSKYYVRYGGVSGIHEAASFPANLNLYGYPFTFAGYRLSYLDSVNEQSRTDGTVALVGPANFTVEFERMKFLCRGNLDSAQLPATIGTKRMVYWNTDIKPLSLQFKPPLADKCSLSNRFLVLGVETKLPFIPDAFHAALGFKPNGNLVTLATAVEGVDSRFAVPANLKLQGPGTSFYPLTTAGDGYFNNWETPGRPNAGFFSVVGRIRVPFFRDPKIQLHVTPTGTNTAQLNLMGGWPAEEGQGANRGWNNGAQNYFNTSKFDANADGWPTGVSLNNYRVSPDLNYRLRAQQNWIDVAGFDYPLAWNPLLRTFYGFEDAIVTLPVIDVNSRLKELTPGKVDFDFAQDINLQLPRIKLLDLANDALNELNAPLDSLSGALRSALGAGLDTSGLTSGFRGLQNVMRENVEGVFRPALQLPLDGVVNTMYPALSNAFAINKTTLLASTAGIVANPANGLSAAIQNLNGSIGQANSVYGQLNQTLLDVDKTLDLFSRILAKDSGGKRHVIGVIMQKLAQDQGPLLGIAGSLADSTVDGLVAELEPTFANIEAQLRELRGQFNQLRQQVGHVATDNDFNEALNLANHDAAALQNYVNQAAAGVSNLMSVVAGPAGDYFTANPARAKQEIRERLTIAFLSSPVPQKYQQTFRQFMYDKNFLLDQLMDVLFDQVNRSIRNGFNIAGAQDGLFKGMKGGGAMGGSLLSAKIRGVPTFEGDSLRKIHLDSEIKMNLPDEMKFSAYMDIKELNSQSTALSCIPDGGPAAEVTLGARDIPLDWLGVSSGGPLTLNVEARWTLQSSAVLGIGGSFEVIGKIGFKGGSINNFGASIAIGQYENYFAAKAGATVTIIAIPVNFNVGIFAGHACSLDPLKFIDPEVEEVLIVKANEFSGIYLQFGGSVSLSDILFGTSSCLLDITARIDYAIYYQGGPRLGSLGGREKKSVSADLICIISAEASYASGFRLDSAGALTLAAKARLCGKIGACPFCLKACATLGITGTVSDGGVDYSIDY